MKCYNHDDMESIGVCTSCGKAICEKCGTFFNNKLLCNQCLNDVNVRKSGSSDTESPNTGSSDTGSSNLLNIILRFINVIVGALFTVIFGLFGLSYLLNNNILYALFCLLPTIGGLSMMYDSLTVKKANTVASILSIICITMVFLLLSFVILQFLFTSG